MHGTAPSERRGEIYRSIARRYYRTRGEKTTPGGLGPEAKGLNPTGPATDACARGLC